MIARESISLVMPVYNEEEGIESALRYCIDQLRSMVDQYEIIVVDDGSVDRTAQIVEQVARQFPRVKLFRNPKNIGSGKSLFLGFKKAAFDFVASNFADLPFDIKELPKALSLFDSVDVDFVVVCRRDRSANTFYRKVTSLANYWAIRFLFGVKMRDFQFVQIYRKKVLDVSEVASKGTFVPPELMIKAVRRGFKFREYVTDFHPRRMGKAKCGSPMVIAETIREMFKFWFYCFWPCFYDR